MAAMVVQEECPDKVVASLLWMVLIWLLGCEQEGPEECHDKVVASLVDVPEEACDLNPQERHPKKQNIPFYGTEKLQNTSI